MLQNAELNWRAVYIMKENVVSAYQQLDVVGEVRRDPDPDYRGLFHDVDHIHNFHITITNSCDQF